MTMQPFSFGRDQDVELSLPFQFFWSMVEFTSRAGVDSVHMSLHMPLHVSVHGVIAACA